VPTSAEVGRYQDDTALVADHYQQGLTGKFCAYLAKCAPFVYPSTACHLVWTVFGAKGEKSGDFANQTPPSMRNLRRPPVPGHVPSGRS